MAEPAQEQHGARVCGVGDELGIVRVEQRHLLLRPIRALEQTSNYTAELLALNERPSADEKMQNVEHGQLVAAGAVPVDYSRHRPSVALDQQTSEPEVAVYPAHGQPPPHEGCLDLGRHSIESERPRRAAARQRRSYHEPDGVPKPAVDRGDAGDGRNSGALVKRADRVRGERLKDAARRHGTEQGSGVTAAKPPLEEVVGPVELAMDEDSGQQVMP